MKKLFASCNDPALLPIRFGLAVVFLFNGSQKLFGFFGGHGIEGVTQFLASLGFHGTSWAWLLACGEFFGGLLILLGFFTRLAALNIFFIMAVAIMTVTGKHGFSIMNSGYEYNFVLMTMALTLMLGGAGKWSIDSRIAGNCCQSDTSTSGGACCS